MSHTARRWVYGTVGVVVLAAAGLYAVGRAGGPDYLSYALRLAGGPDYLSQVDAYATRGQLDSAEALLRQHVMNHPHDFQARIRYGTLLLQRADTSNGITVLEEVQRDAVGTDDTLWRVASRTLRAIARVQAHRADSISQVWVRRGRFDSAAAYARTAAEAYLRVRALDARLGDTTKLARLIGEIYVAWAAAEQVMASHLGRGASSSSDRLLGATPVSAGDADLWQETLERTQYLLDSLGSAAFAAGRWAAAERHYLRLRSLSAIKEDSCGEAGALYNAAMANWNAGHYTKSRRLLAFIRDSFPFYEPDVQSRPAGVGTAASIRDVQRILRQAYSEFVRRHWPSARDYYREALRVMEAQSRGTPSLVAATMYNIAVTYYNEAQYGEARARLLELQARFPTYRPDVVKNVLLKIP